MFPIFIRKHATLVKFFGLREMKYCLVSLRLLVLFLTTEDFLGCKWGYNCTYLHNFFQTTSRKSVAHQ